MKHHLLRILKTGWTNFKRNSYLSFAVTGIMALVLLLVLGLFTFQALTSRAVSTIKEKVDISAYFKVATPEEQILEVKNDLQRLPEVSAVAYTSRQQALDDFRRDHADEPATIEALEQLDDHPFEASLNIRAKNPEQYSAIATFLENSRYRDSMTTVDYNENKAVIDKITGFAANLKVWGLAITLVLAIIAALITFNTIRLTIYNQRQEIEIMRLVGASNWHIQGPYLAEGAFYGVIGALVALAVFYPILYLASDNLDAIVPQSNMMRYFLVNSWQVLLIVLIVGILLGTLSSFIAIRKHLKI